MIEYIIQQEKDLLELKKFFENKKPEFVDPTSNNQTLTYSCSYFCLTINPLKSERFDFSKPFIDFFITESRNELKFKLRRMISKAKEEGENLKIQVNGSIGTGKTFGLADFVVLERMLNLQSKDKIIIYYNFHNKSNKRSPFYLKREILSAIYPFIKDELNKALNSKKEITSIELEKDSLLHLVFVMLKEKNDIKEIYLIDD